MWDYAFIEHEMNSDTKQNKKGQLEKTQFHHSIDMQACSKSYTYTEIQTLVSWTHLTGQRHSLCSVTVLPHGDSCRHSSHPNVVGVGSPAVRSKVGREHDTVPISSHLSGFTRRCCHCPFQSTVPHHIADSRVLHCSPGYFQGWVGIG